MIAKPKLKPASKTINPDEVGIRVEIIKENKDGSADAKVHFDSKGLETLVQWGIVSLLTAAIDEYRVEPDESSKTTKRARKPTAKSKASKK